MGAFFCPNFCPTLKKGKIEVDSAAPLSLRDPVAFHDTLRLDGCSTHTWRERRRAQNARNAHGV